MGDFPSVIVNDFNPKEPGRWVSEVPKIGAAVGAVAEAEGAVALPKPKVGAVLNAFIGALPKPGPPIAVPKAAAPPNGGIGAAVGNPPNGDDV